MNRRSEHTDRRGTPLLKIALVVVLSVTVAPPIAQAAVTGGGGAPDAVRPTGQNGATAVTQLTAHDGAFWIGTSKIVLKGFNFAPDSAPESQMNRIEGWGSNFTRLRFRWDLLEPTAPVRQQDGTWKHTYDPLYLKNITDRAAQDWRHGVWTLLDNHNCTDATNCGFWPWPDYLFKAAYNSHGVTYPQTADGLTQANTDFWSDPLRQDDEMQMWIHVVNAVKGIAGIMGYEIHNEPQNGSLPNRAATTQLMLDWQLNVAKAVRTSDPSRVIVFATRSGYGPGLQHADLSGWRSLPGTPVGNVAFDIHDYFGGRWGDGINENPTNPDYSEVMSILYDHVLDDNAGPYVGNTASQVRLLQQATTRLQGIPLLVGEVGDDQGDPGINVYYGTVTSALTTSGVSWAASYGGHVGIVDANDNLTGYGQIVVAAMKAS